MLLVCGATCGRQVDSSSSLASSSFKLVFSFLWTPLKLLHVIVLVILLFWHVSLYVRALWEIPPSTHVVLSALYRPVTHSESSAPWLLPADKWLHLPLVQSLPSAPSSLTPFTFIQSALPTPPPDSHSCKFAIPFPLHPLPTCLPIPENKLKALTQCVPNQK